MSLVRTACIAETFLHRVALDRAVGLEADRVARHVADCARCRRRLRSLRDHVEAARFAVNLLSPEVPFCELHETSDGLVRVWAESAGAGWRACCHGPGLDIASTFPSAADAVRQAMNAFTVLFPNHTCSLACCAPGHDPEQPRFTM